MEIGLQRLPKTLPTLLQMWRLDGAFWRKNSHFQLGVPLSIVIMLPLLYRYMASGCNSILKKIWESLTYEFCLIRLMKAIFWWHIWVDPWKVLWMSKFGCSDIVWVQFIKYTQFFLCLLFLPRRFAFTKIFYIFRVVTGMLRQWLMSNLGCLYGILFCFSFPLVSYFSFTILVKRSRSTTFINDLLAFYLA